MEPHIVLNVIYGNKTYIIAVNKETKYEDFLSNIFFKITNIIEPDETNKNKFNETIIEKFRDTFVITWITKHINDSTWTDVRDMLESNDTIFISNKLNGGFAFLIVLAIFAILSPILKPIRKMVEVILELFGLLGKFVELLLYVIEIIPLIFDPPRLIDDILFAITSSLNIVFKKMGGDVKNLVSSPEDDSLEKGPFGVSNENQNAFTCMDPSWSTIMLLIICPPLAIIYKLGFGPGFISSIICGVLCVKLYYFPGLLFAILHVLC